MRDRNQVAMRLANLVTQNNQELFSELCYAQISMATIPTLYLMGNYEHVGKNLAEARAVLDIVDDPRERKAVERNIELYNKLVRELNKDSSLRGKLGQIEEFYQSQDL